MTQDPADLNIPEQIQLSEIEASELAEELKKQLRQGGLEKTDHEQIVRMVAGLGDRRGMLRLTFAESLGTVGSTAVPYLCDAMRNHDSVTVRRAAAKTLTLIADPASLDDLMHALLNDPDPVVQGSAVGAMVAIGAEAVDGLLDVLINPESSEMQLGMASWGLSFVGSRAPDSLRKAARSEHAQIRMAAIAALGDQIQNLDDQDARQLLTEALNDQSAEVRAEATTLLGKLHDDEWAEPLLLPKLTDQDPDVRKNSALSLMKLGAVSSIPAIQQSQAEETNETVLAIFKLSINQLEKQL